MTKPVVVKFVGDSISFDEAAEGVNKRLGDFGKKVEDEGKRAGKGFERAGEGADKGEQRILGAKDAVDGVATVMQGPGKAGITAYIQGWADIASGFANFILPTMGDLTEKLRDNAKGTITGAVATVRDTTAKVGHTVASKAVTVATWAQTVAQRALNLAMRANPIGLVITAIMLLVAALVIAYKRSETFRNIVNGAFRGVLATGQALWHGLSASVGAIRSDFGGLVDWFRKLPGRISDAMAALPRLLLDRFSGAVKSVLKFLGIKSPSTVFEEIGANVVRGLARGIDGGMKGNLFGGLASMVATFPRDLTITRATRGMGALGNFKQQVSNSWQGWYGSGLAPTVFSSPTLIGVGERGPERVSVTPMGRSPASGGITQIFNIQTKEEGVLYGRRVSREVAWAMRASGR